MLDFGIARSVGRSRRLTNPGVAMGTPEYMAPEQAAGGVVDHRSDIYSVGALLYEMVTGSPPQKRGQGADRAARCCATQLPEELDRIIVRALGPIPAQRYQTMAQLEYDLVKSLWGRPRAVAELLGLRVDAPSARETTPRADAAAESRSATRCSNAGRAPARRPLESDAARAACRARARAVTPGPPGRRRSAACAARRAGSGGDAAPQGRPPASR